MKGDSSMNELQIFNNDKFGQVRTIIINNEPWFIAKDVATALGYMDTKQAIRINVDNEDKKHLPKSEFRGCTSTTSKINNNGAVVINESGLYALIFGSKLKEAKEFKHWVTAEVLPSIRKTGSYQIQPMTTEEKIATIAQGYQEVNDKLNTLDTEISEIKERLNVIGAFDNEWMLKKLRGVTSAKVLNLTSDPIFREVWSRYFFAAIYKDLKDTYKVATLKSIPVSYLDSAIENIAHWYPTDVFLSKRIDEMQRKMEANLLPDKKVIAFLQYMKITDQGRVNPFK